MLQLILYALLMALKCQIMLLLKTKLGVYDASWLYIIDTHHGIKNSTAVGITVSIQHTIYVLICCKNNIFSFYDHKECLKYYL
jgi:hypothetical protein